MLIDKCHFIGIGGIGMSGLAKILLNHNCKVSGSDVASGHVTDSLARLGAEIFIGHDFQHIKPNMTVIYGSDIKADNPEYQAALHLKCKILHRSDLLSILMSGYRTLAVAGTHGKTTTSALLTWVLKDCGLDPSYAIGGILSRLQSNADKGQGPYFVAEADESDGTFLKYAPFGGIVTNIDLDHMGHFGTEEVLVKSFKTFMLNFSAPEHLLWCGDDPRLSHLNVPGISYGRGNTCDWRLQNVLQQGWTICFDADFRGKKYSGIEVPLVGEHNALNALAVFALAHSLGIDEKAIRSAFKSFGGVLRRCEKKGEAGGVLVIDDYAHHPTEILTTLKGVRQAIQDRRLIVVFQPHRFSRVKDCLGQFKDVFEEADELFLTDIYSAGELPIEGLTYQNVLEELHQARLPVRYIPRNELEESLAKILRPHDVVITLGAGDLPKLGESLVQKLQKHPPSKIKIGVVFGGRSVEHEISLLSAKHVTSSLREEFYEVVNFGITKLGEWICGNEAMKTLEKKVGEPQTLISSEVMQELLRCDVLFPVLHGPYGEDGTIQGFFDILDKAYVGCDHRSSAFCMNKALTKRLMEMNNIDTSPFVDFSHFEWNSNRDHILKEIVKKLVFPVFVKPAHLGSSIGVHKVEDPKKLTEAILDAFRFDNHLLVENGLKGREIEFAVLGNERVTVFPPGEVCTEGKIYTYEGKYGDNSFKTVSRAEISPSLIQTGMRVAEKAYRAAGCNGMARVDFFLDQEGLFWLNEINPIPGFTKISLYPQICERNGLHANELMDNLVILAMRRKLQQRKYSIGD